MRDLSLLTKGFKRNYCSDLNSIYICINQCFSYFLFFRGGTPKIIGHIPRNPCLWKELLAHGGYSNISNCRTRIIAIFRGIFIIFCGISKQLCSYSTISLKTPNGALWNGKVPRTPVWETLVWTIQTPMNEFCSTTCFDLITIMKWFQNFGQSLIMWQFQCTKNLPIHLLEARPRMSHTRTAYLLVTYRVHLMITIQKVTSNVQSVPRQSPDIYWHAELCSGRSCSV